MGMTPEQFWEGDCALTIAYQKAYKQQRQLRNEDAWLQGMYVYEVLMSLYPAFNAWAKEKKVKEYRKEPYDLGYLEPQKKQTKEERQLVNGKRYMEQFMITFNAKFKGGETDGG